MQRTKIAETVKKIHKIIKILGRAQTIRDHGKVTLIDVVDESGLVQTVTRSSSQISLFRPKTSQVAKKSSTQARDRFSNT